MLNQGTISLDQMSLHHEDILFELFGFYLLQQLHLEL